MFVSLPILGFGLFSLICGGVSVIYAVAICSFPAAILGLFFLICAAILLLCWKNESVRMLSEDEFEFTSILGKKRRYFFSDITGLRRYEGSYAYTLLLGRHKLHIKRHFRLTRRFVERINQQLTDDSRIS